jgi:hypothetical protein
MFVILLAVLGLMLMSSVLLVSACIASSRMSHAQEDETAYGYAPAAHAYGD